MNTDIILDIDVLALCAEARPDLDIKGGYIARQPAADGLTVLVDAVPKDKDAYLAKLDELQRALDVDDLTMEMLNESGIYVGTIRETLTELRKRMSC